MGAGTDGAAAPQPVLAQGLGDGEEVRGSGRGRLKSASPSTNGSLKLRPKPCCALSAQEAVVRGVTDSSAPIEQLMGAEVWEARSEVQRDHLLVLRGLLACDVLVHCLQKRHAVTYGVNR